MATVVVAGALAAKPGNGGEAWVRLSWVLGLMRLGHDVWFLEQVDRATADGRAFFEDETRRHGVEEHSILLEPDGAAGPLDRTALEDLAADADLLIDISGNLRDPDLLGRFGRRAYVDLDPGFTQLWHSEGHLGEQLEGYDAHFTVGTNIGSADCSIPLAGIDWIPTPPPVLLDEWEPLPERSFDRFTTVATWRNAFGAPDASDQKFTLKHHEFRRFSELPSRAGAPFEVALDIHPLESDDRERLVALGWNVIDPASVAADSHAFRDYLRGSGAEFSVTQGVYAQTRSGWISDRTAHYLAAGRPAIVQDTGVPARLHADAGILTFSDMTGALDAVERVLGSYEEHAAAARRFAEQAFDSDRVLARVLEAAGG